MTEKVELRVVLDEQRKPDTFEVSITKSVMNDLGI